MNMCNFSSKLSKEILEIICNINLNIFDDVPNSLLLIKTLYKDKIHMNYKYKN